MSSDVPASRIVEALGLQPHPEGGWYRETFRDAASTAILYMLEEGQVSAWHRVRNAAEAWHFYAGGPLRLRLAPPDDAETKEVLRRVSEVVLGPEVLDGHTPQAVAPAGWWQSAEPLGRWTLVGCTVAPAFQFEAFEMAPAGWEPV